MVNKSKDYYEILGVEQSASLEEIKSRYKFLVYVFHPDRLQGSNLQSDAENELKRINEAYAVLSNQDRRKEYDSILLKKEKFEGEEEKKSPNSEKTEKANEILSYINEIVTHWANRWDQLPYDDELNKLITSIKWHSDNIIFGTKFLWNPEASDQQEMVKRLLFYTIIACLSLGIEKREKGLTTPFLEDEILTSISNSFTETLTHIAAITVKKSLLTESEALYHLGQLYKLVFNVCLLSFYLLSGKVKIIDDSPKNTKTSPQTNGRVQNKPNIQTDRRVVEKNDKTPAIISILGLLTLTFCMMIIFFTTRTEKSSYPTSTPQRMVNSFPTNPPRRETVTPYPTRTRPNPTPTSSCNKWNTVTIDDQGKTLCVYGDVRNTYFAGNNFHISFGAKDSDFRFIISNGYFYEGLSGKCVLGRGTVEVYNSLPYIIVVDLYKCP